MLFGGVAEMSERMRLGQINFGPLDAREGLLSRDQSQKRHFLQSFVIPEGLSIDEYVEGTKCLIAGVKGSGKTAFLRFIQNAVKAKHHITKFIVFQEDIGERQREHILPLADVDIHDLPEIDKEIDVTDIWQIFLYREIARLVEENEGSFNINAYIKDFNSTVKSIYDGDNRGLFQKLIDVVRKGKVEVRAFGIGGKVEADLRKREPNADINIHEAIRRLELLATKISLHDDRRIYIFIDELNLSMTSRKQHKRDVILIRDLLMAVSKLNRRFSEANVPIFILSAVRAEVKAARGVQTREIDISDNGRELPWFAWEQISYTEAD
jgi:hypothetical protein